MQATLNFTDRSQAQEFVIAWGRFSKTGHTMGAGMENVEVTVYNLTDDHIAWINGYVSKLNN